MGQVNFVEIGVNKVCESSGRKTIAIWIFRMHTMGISVLQQIAIYACRIITGRLLSHTHHTYPVAPQLCLHGHLLLLSTLIKRHASQPASPSQPVKGNNNEEKKKVTCCNMKSIKHSITHCAHCCLSHGARAVHLRRGCAFKYP